MRSLFIGRHLKELREYAEAANELHEERERAARMRAEEERELGEINGGEEEEASTHSEGAQQRGSSEDDSQRRRKQSMPDSTDDDDDASNASLDHSIDPVERFHLPGDATPITPAEAAKKGTHHLRVRGVGVFYDPFRHVPNEACSKDPEVRAPTTATILLQSIHRDIEEYPLEGITRGPRGTFYLTGSAPRDMAKIRPDVEALLRILLEDDTITVDEVVRMEIAPESDSSDDDCKPKALDTSFEQAATLKDPPERSVAPLSPGGQPPTPLRPVKQEAAQSEDTVGSEADDAHVDHSSTHPKTSRPRTTRRQPGQMTPTVDPNKIIALNNKIKREEKERQKLATQEEEVIDSESEPEGKKGSSKMTTGNQ